MAYFVKEVFFLFRNAIILGAAPCASKTSKNYKFPEFPLTLAMPCCIITTACRILASTLTRQRMKKPPLANAELAVMKLLWQKDRLTARYIREQLYPDSTKAQHGTVQRLLQRLEDKGYIARDRSLSVHLFSTKINGQAYAVSQMESLAAKLTGGSLAPLITHLVEGKKLSRKELNRLRAILNENRTKEDQHD